MENSEDILKALEEFNDKPSNAEEEALPSVLETYFRRVAATGETVFHWHLMKKAFMHQLQRSMLEFVAEETPSDKVLNLPNVENVKCTELQERLLTTVDGYVGAPFTIQRLAELIMYPHKHYKKPAKWLRGIEKNVNVVSTVDPFGKRIVNESKMVNGLDATNGLDDSNVLMSPDRSYLPPPPVNSPVSSIPGWFNTTSNTGNGDSAAVYSWSRSEDDENSDDIPKQNGAKRQKNTS